MPQDGSIMGVCLFTNHPYACIYQTPAVMYDKVYVYKVIPIKAYHYIFYEYNT